ncbi:MAG: hypothetical protein IKK03_13965 [Lachnospiraceae bacterium]|nr:hypothetical protein [Lachnospiraceae bacterium]
MYYTEGFLKEDTYFSHGHIWHFGMTWDKKECFFWCVSEESLGKEMDMVDNVLKMWFEQELTQALEQGVVEIQRELNRFSARFKQWNGLKKDVKSPMLYLYFQGNIYSSETDEAVLKQYRGHRGVVLSWDAVPGGKGDNIMGNYLTEWLAESKEQSQSPEEAANCLKADMLAAMSRGTLKRGYFILWEAEDDF